MKPLGLTSYVLLLWLFFLSVCLTPGTALSLEATQYARVVAQAEQIAYLAAQRSALAASVASAAVASSPGSLALRLVAGPVGWAALGVTAGLVISQMYYSPAELQAVKAAAAPPSGRYTWAGLDGQLIGGSAGVTLPGATAPNPNCPGGTQYGLANTGFGSPLMPANWWFNAGMADWWCPRSAPQAVTGIPSQTDVQQYVQALPTSDPNSIESHTTPVGQGQPVQPAETVQIQPVSPSDLPTTVKQKPIPAGDAIVVENVPPPSGSTQQTTQTQQTTTTTTTTQNPDGSTTQQEDTQATTSCAVGIHESRTFGSVLEAHQVLWASSGLLSALNLLKSLTWPTTLPVVSLPSTFFGNQQVDFNQWGWFFVVLRSLVIAMASLGAYRIIFVGGRT